MTEQAISAQRVQSLLDNGAKEGWPDYWYGATSEDGALWGELFAHRSEAAKLAEDLRGQVVIVVARILENDNGEQIEPEN